MRRLFFAPQYPSRLRYQEWWYKKIPEEMKKYFDEVIVLGDLYIENKKELEERTAASFSNLKSSIELESEQTLS